MDPAPPPSRWCVLRVDISVELGACVPSPTRRTPLSYLRVRASGGTWPLERRSPLLEPTGNDQIDQMSRNDQNAVARNDQMSKRKRKRRRHVAQEVERVSWSPEGRWFDPRLHLAECRVPYPVVENAFSKQVSWSRSWLLLMLLLLLTCLVLPPPAVLRQPAGRAPGWRTSSDQELSLPPL